MSAAPRRLVRACLLLLGNAVVVLAFAHPCAHLVSVGCGGAFWDDSQNTAPTHDLIQGNTNGHDTGGPLFMRATDAGVDLDASLGAAKSVVDAVTGER